MTRAAVLGAGSWGTTFAKVLADAGCEVTLHARRAELAKAITDDGENRDYLPGHPPALRGPGDRGRGGGAARGRDRRARRPLAVAARQPDGVGAAAAGGLHPAVADEGHRARHHQADERGHLRGDRRRAGARRRHLRAQPGPRDRRGAAGRDGDRLHGRGAGRDPAGGLPHALLPAVHEPRHRRLRARRGREERHRARRRHRRGAGLRRQHPRLAHHPRAGRDRPARHGPRCGADHVRRARRPR